MSHHQHKTTTGVPGLDEVLGGGLPTNGMYLLQGSPGAGKTTLALQFLLEAQRVGEQGLYLALTESKADLESVARGHGWLIDGLTICERRLTDGDDSGDQTMFHPAEVALEGATKPIIAAIEREKPARVVVDSLSEIRLLAGDPLRYRRTILTLKNLFFEHGCTAIMIDTLTEDPIVETVAAGVISLDKVKPLYGTTRRRISIEKLRGIGFREGFHDFLIQTGGLVVFPRLVAGEHTQPFNREAIESGVPELDKLLGGGLERGTSSLLLGSAGTGKSSLATQYVAAAASNGEKSAILLFDETIGTWRARSGGLGFEVEPHLASGRLRLTQVDPADLSPGELSTRVRQAVEEDGVRFVVIDSLNGYLQSVPEETFLILHLHELLTYLAQQGVTTLMIMAQHGLLGPSISSPIDLTYLADAVLLIRHFEAGGALRQAISVVKKRSGPHERTIRELRMDEKGVHVGAPLEELQGVLMGAPTYTGGKKPLKAGS